MWRREPACKPGSVGDSHSSGMHVAVHLERPTRERVRAARCGLGRVFPYLVLLRVGFTLPPTLPPARCALTAPFHPYRPVADGFRRYVFCGTFRRLAPPRRYLAPCPAEPGLSSPASIAGATARPTPCFDSTPSAARRRAAPGQTGEDRGEGGGSITGLSRRYQRRWIRHSRQTPA